MGWNPFKETEKFVKKTTHKVFHNNTMKSVLPTALATVGTVLSGPVGGAVGGGVGSMLTGGNTAENIGAAAGGSLAGIGAYAGQKTARNMFGKVGSVDEGEDTSYTAEEQLVTERGENKKKRRALYATKGGSLGEEVDSVGDTFGVGRGTLFGN